MKETAEDFTWDQATTATKFGFGYTDEERAELVKLYEETLTPINKYEVVQGTVVSINKRDIIIDIGAKSDGSISLSEFRDMPDLKPGDAVEVYIEEQENAKGQLVLSRRKAKLMRAWEAIQEAADNNEVIESFVKRKTKGGLIVDLAGVEAFLPGSQIDIKPIRDFDAFVGKPIDVTIIKINHITDNVIVSHKTIIEKSLVRQSSIISNLERGQILEGIIKNMASFGAFIDLGGIDGLLHITDIVWHKIKHPEEVLKLGQKVKVVVIDLDEGKKRIALGMKQLTPHPWENLPAFIQIGEKVKGRITKIADYGAFMEIIPGIEGLIHVSEISWSQYSKRVQDVLRVGDEIEAVILTINREERKISLGIKQLTKDPWTKEGLQQKYAVGTKHTGIIRHITHFGALVALEEGIDGLLHISDLSWTRKINHPADVLKLGDKIELVVLENDKENRRLALGLKQLQEDPWDVYKETFQVDSIHSGTIIKKIDKGAFIELPHGLEGFVPKRHLIKEDGQEAAVHEKLDFQVIEFSKANKRIVLVHAPTFKKDKGSLEGENHPRNTGNKMEAAKPTLADVETLATLKQQLEAEKLSSQKRTQQEVAKQTE
ncbi:MAG: 30S ribosomal protein S1 [Bacteroidota bacterium]